MTSNKKLKWEPDKFELQTNTVWSFPDRGNWATHNSKYRGNWSPYIPRNLILRYSKEGDTILDQFAGSGTTLIEAKLLNRNCIGVDINAVSIELCRENTDFERENCGHVTIKRGDARDLSFINDKSIDFICTHPPYANIIKYSNDIIGDLSCYEVGDFLKEMKKVAAECYRILKEDKYCAILIGDTRKKGHIVPIGFEVMKVFEAIGLKIKEIIIKEQHNCTSTCYWRNKSTKYNFLLLAHEYLFVFKK
ncbi:TRM11 family SAM-dependent methyltransferase [Desulfitibacter alkalitolerans]|uniref:TRM11 family SAM-dependent methyltransferase n=1 Tax=Desulfitibacter alkalitolerans TaxID=264641 RepID=UPI000489F02C|nr:DNA methyltransferase [Desulfitibacter alkalitolerans]